MKKLLITWLIPLLVAVVIVFTAKTAFFSTYVIKSNCMSPNLKEGDKVLCFKKKARKRNKIVLFTSPSEGAILLKRQIAIPGDTLAVKEGTFVVNCEKVVGIKGVTRRFSFQSDSIATISRYLNENNIKTSIKKAYLGYFDCQLEERNVNELKTNLLVSALGKISLEPKIRLDLNNFGSEFYWNHDNLGSLIVPKKGMQIKLGRRSFHLYKDIIEAETGEKVVLKSYDVCIGKEKVDIYTFKRNYYFLVNDNRDNKHDSRTYGFIAENNIIGTFVMKLPW